MVEDVFLALLTAATAVFNALAVLLAALTALTTMRIVRENFTLVVGVNSVGLILGAASGISVMMSAMLHNMSTILVVANSLRLMFFPPTERREML